MRYLFKIDGMGCQHCVKRVHDALEAAGAEHFADCCEEIFTILNA